MKERRLYGIIGNPVIHSLSPALFRGAFEANNLLHQYLRLVSDSARDAVELAKEIDLAGVNVTAPFKQDVLDFSTQQSVEVKKLRAANTLVFEGDKILAHNTDVDGILDSLKEPLTHLIKPKTVILGTGGAARAAVYAATQARFETVLIGRSERAGQEISQEMGVPFIPLASPKVENTLQNSEVLISCVSTTDRVIPPSSLHPKLIVLDALYSKESALLRDAKAIGCTIVDGKEWLLRQGAKAFQLFTGLPSPLRAMRTGLQQAEKVSRPKHIALIGFMGSGKTEVGRLLAEVLGYEFVDLDATIEAQQGTTISEIFEIRGENYFRKIESMYLQSLDLRTPKVLSTGGGTILAEENRLYLRQNFFSIWLWVPPKQLGERLKNDTSRPLLAKAGGNIDELFSIRAPFYAETSELVINAKRQAIALAQRLHSELKAWSLAA